MRILTACIGLAALLGTASQAALPPCAEDQRVRAATDVVQISVMAVDVPRNYASRDHAVCRVTGQILKVFRGAEAPGRLLSMAVTCHTKTVGGGRIVPPDVLQSTKVLEVHLLEGKPIQAGPGIIPLEAATDEMAWKPNCP